MQPTPTLDIRIEALFSAPEIMTVKEAAQVLGHDHRTVRALCHSRSLTAQVLTDAAGGSSAGARKKKVRGYNNLRFTITRAALLKHMIRQTTGGHELILQAVAQTAPAWLPFARSIAHGRTEAPIPGSNTNAKQRPKNVLDFEHPDLFGHTPAQASA